jgi:hypothetical protein
MYPNATANPPRSACVLKAILRHAAFSFFSVYVCSRFSSRAETLSNGLFRSDLRKPHTQVNGAAAAMLCYVPRYDNQTACKSLDRACQPCRLRSVPPLRLCPNITCSNRSDAPALSAVGLLMGKPHLPHIWATSRLRCFPPPPIGSHWQTCPGNIWTPFIWAISGEPAKLFGIGRLGISA